MSTDVNSHFQNSDFQRSPHSLQQAVTFNFPKWMQARSDQRVVVTAQRDTPAFSVLVPRLFLCHLSIGQHRRPLIELTTLYTFAGPSSPMMYLFRHKALIRWPELISERITNAKSQEPQRSEKGDKSAGIWKRAGAKPCRVRHSDRVVRQR